MRSIPWFVAAGVWLIAGTWADFYIMSSGEIIPRAWIFLWYGPPLKLTITLAIFAGFAALVWRGGYLLLSGVTGDHGDG